VSGDGSLAYRPPRPTFVLQEDTLDFVVSQRIWSSPLSLGKPVHAEISIVLGLPTGSTLADAVAAMHSRAVNGDVSTARELAERTEGHVPTAASREGKIDYAAGRDAKEQLLKKLGR
jgi:hypothetical protein